MNNRQIAKLLRSVAAAYEIKKANRFKIIAYERAATAVEHAGTEIKDFWDEDKLTSLAGIGPNIAKHLDELFRTGQVKHFHAVTRGLPPAMFELLDLPGIGAKTAFKLCRELKIRRASSALSRLKKAAKKGQINPKFLSILKNYRKNKKQARMPLPFAWNLAKKIIYYLQKEKAVLAADHLGSLRRMAATVGDIDLATATYQPKKVIDHFTRYPEAKKVIASGENTARILLKSGQQIDLKTQTPDKYGALLQHFTGSKQHNIHLREIAQKKGLSLSEYGIKKTQNFSTEKGFYQALGMKWIPPELREDTGEIEASQQNQLPSLIKLEAIKGDLHTHSNFNIETSHDDGVDSMKTMIQKAQNLGYQYLGFSEHNPSSSQHKNSEILSIIKRKKGIIEKLNYSIKKNTQNNNIRILNGLEIDIKPDGRLALSEASLNELDYAIAAIHTSFNLSRQKMTDRILAGLSHPKVKILAHPTGRKLDQREGYELDWEKIFDFCQKNDKWLEINACPDRLDLPDLLVKEAVKNGVKMIINSDSHEAEAMNLMFYGVAVARRGWAEAKDITNTLPWLQFRQKINL